MNGHRREVSCLDVVKGNTNIVASGSKDRKLIIWCLESGRILDYVSEAHERLITCVKFLQSSNMKKGSLSSVLLFTSSRDRRVKIWRIQNKACVLKAYSMTLEQTLQGHVHSVWVIDCTLNYLVAGSADKTIRVWKNNSCDEEYSLQGDIPLYNPHCHFENEGAGVRQLLILENFPNLVLSGDLLGDLNMWNIETKTLQYSVPELSSVEGHRQSLFRIAGAVIGMSQVKSSSTVAVAFGSERIDLFSTSEAFTQLLLLRTIDLNSSTLNILPQRSEHRYVRGILATRTELYVCGISGKHGLLLFDFWK